MLRTLFRRLHEIFIASCTQILQGVPPCTNTDWSQSEQTDREAGGFFSNCPSQFGYILLGVERNLCYSSRGVWNFRSIFPESLSWYALNKQSFRPTRNDRNAASVRHWCGS